jgi:hypothetical protein
MASSVEEIYARVRELPHREQVRLAELLSRDLTRAAGGDAGEKSASSRYDETMAAIRKRQAARGHRPRTRAEVDAALREERESWED